jgi:signal transduction histidine kinase
MVLDISDRKKLEIQVQETIHDLAAAKKLLEEQAGALENEVRDRTVRLQETITELESFSYSISHDLRGPLRVIESFAQALREDCGDEVSALGKDYIRRIVAGAERMDRVIQDVLVYSRIGRTDLKLEPVDLAEFIPSFLEGFPGVHNESADILIEGTLPRVLASPAALTQCFSNLIDNAIKFVARGVRPAVRIACEIIGARAFLSIQDNGIGIPKESHEMIFGVFTRLEQNFEGTGIGLAIVRRAVERMGGKVTVQSEKGAGSVFTFDLLLAP